MGLKPAVFGLEARRLSIRPRGLLRVGGSLAHATCGIGFLQSCRLRHERHGLPSVSKIFHRSTGSACHVIACAEDGVGCQQGSCGCKHAYGLTDQRLIHEATSCKIGLGQAIAKSLRDQLHENLPSHSCLSHHCQILLLWKSHTFCYECIFFAFWTPFLREQPGPSCKFGSAPGLEVGLGFVLVAWSGFGVQPLAGLSAGVRISVVASTVKESRAFLTRASGWKLRAALDAKLYFYVFGCTFWQSRDSSVGRATD